MSKKHTINVMGNVLTREVFIVFLTIGNALADFLYIYDLKSNNTVNIFSIVMQYQNLIEI